MNYIENIYICLVAPILISILSLRGRGRPMMIFVFSGMTACLLSSYISTFVAAMAGMDYTTASITVTPVVEELMKLLPECYDPETQRINFEYYERRTLHRSSLSPSVHAWMAARLGLAEHAYPYLKRSAFVDLDNNQRNTREGLHAASMGGTWQAVVMGFCGLHLNERNEVAFDPHLPPNWKQVRFRIRRHGKPVQVTVTHAGAEITEL